MKYDLVTFGEAMVRLTSPDYMRLEQARSLKVSVGGAEWNVAVNVSRLVDTSNVMWEKFDGMGVCEMDFFTWSLGPAREPATYLRSRALRY